MSAASSGSYTHRLPHSLSAESPSLLHNFLTDTLLGAKIKKKDSKTSRYVHMEKNSDLVISIPDAHKMKYKIRFFDGDNRFLFEIPELQDSLLVIEKYNFQHAGQFQYELYKENMLMERKTFLIKKD